MDRAAVVAFGAVLLLVCIYWTYGYIRRRSKKRYWRVGIPTGRRLRRRHLPI